jgi:hypothetical protein
MTGIDPQWTERLDSGRIIDPLQLDTVRNRMLTDLMWGVVSIQIYQRLRYIPFSLWCLDNLEDPSRHDLIPFEKIFLLANVAHEHSDEKGRGENGLSGAGNVPWSQSDFYETSNESFSISDESFQIQNSGSSGFSSYYQGIMERLLLIDGLELTPLGKEIADAFDQSVGVEFEELEDAVKQDEADRELVLDFTDSCCCLLNGQEEELLRKAYFGLISSSRTYENLSWMEPGEKDQFQLESESAEEVMEFLEADGVIDIDEYLKRYFSGSYGSKMRDSFLLFLWIAYQQENGFQPLSEVEELEEIQGLWRLYRYYDFFNFGSEALLTAVLRGLRDKSNPVHPDALLSDIVSSEVFSQTVNAVLEGVEVEDSGEEQDGLDMAYQYVYYGEPTGYESDIDIVEPASGFTGSWPELLDRIEEEVDASSFDVDAKISEWKLKRLIEEEVSDGGNSMESASRIFAYTTVLFGLLKLRHEEVFSQDDHRSYWGWFTKFEKKPPGPVSLLRSLDSDQELQVFAQQLGRRWAIVQYNEALYEKMDTSRMPRLFSKDYTGKIDYQESWSPTLSETKFDRMVDVFFDLGLLEEPSTSSFSVTSDGRSWLSQFVEVDQ